MEEGRAPLGLAGLVSNPRVRERLGITPEQVSKIHHEEMNFRKAQIPTRAELEVKRIELAELRETDAIGGDSQFSRSTGHCYQTPLLVWFHCRRQNRPPRRFWQAIPYFCARS